MDDEDIYRKNRDDLIRHATVLVGPADADDVVSTVVLRVLARQRLGDLDEPRPYLFRAVLNESRALLGRRRAPLTVTDVVFMPEVERPEVLEAVLGLPAQQRAATYLVYWAGTSITETETLMGIRPGTVKRYLYLARRVLRGTLHGS
ncbi:MAG: sigma-70 family RNA polymerase sigma factor [Actinomycetia bacterium]|nr:sigma-70 family RNA polymerase sigma factor [Actinomycetes bacterium]